MSRRKHTKEDILNRHNRLIELLDGMSISLQEDHGVKERYWDLLGFLEYEVFVYLHDYVGEEERNRLLQDADLKHTYGLWKYKEKMS